MNYQLNISSMNLILAIREEGGAALIIMYCHQIKTGGRYDQIRLYRQIINQNDHN